MACGPGGQASCAADASGRRLPRGPRAVALSVPNLDSEHTLALVRGVQQGLRGQGCTTLITCSDDNPWWERRQVLLAREHGVAGMIVYPAEGPRNAPVFQELANARLPLVYVGRHHDGVTADRVVTDNAAGAAAGVEFLLERGHRRIAFVNGHERGVSAINERLQGYCEAFERRGLVPDFRQVLLDVLGRDVPDSEANRHLAAVWAENAPTAALTVNRWAARALRRHLCNLGLQCEIVAFTGADVSESPSWLAAALGVPSESMGLEAAALMARRIGGDWGDWPLHRVVSVELQGKAAAAVPGLRGEREGEAP